MKGESVVLGGETWTVVDVAPAAPLAEMVAALLEDEGFIATVRAPGLLADALSALGTHSLGTHYVLVPEAQAEAALALIAETVSDFEGEDLERFLESLDDADEA
jgi:hypothetical protein